MRCKCILAYKHVYPDSKQSIYMHLQRPGLILVDGTSFDNVVSIKSLYNATMYRPFL